jgi:hypothetical protein
MLAQPGGFNLTEVVRVSALVANDPKGIQWVPGLLRIVEIHPDEDFGMPGSLVHAVERFFGKGYEAALIDSVHRAPNAHNLWMIQRILNRISKHERVDFEALLNDISTRKNVSAHIAVRANEILAGSCGP